MSSQKIKAMSISLALHGALLLALLRAAGDTPVAGGDVVSALLLAQESRAPHAVPVPAPRLEEVDRPTVDVPRLPELAEHLPTPATASTPSSSTAITVADAGAVAAIGAASLADSPGLLAEVTPPRFDADYLRNPAPPYPPASRALREMGEVVLQVDVAPSGAVSALRVYRSSGYPRLDVAALMAVKRWRFVPARRGTTAVAASVLVPIEFQIHSMRDGSTSRSASTGVLR